MKEKGFYFYGKTGVQITVDNGKDEPGEEKSATPLFNIKNIIIDVLAVVVAFLMFSNISTNKRVDKLEDDMVKLTNSANQALSLMQQMITNQVVEIDGLKATLKEAGIIAESETSSTTEHNTTDTGNIGNNTENATDITDAEVTETTTTNTQGGSAENE